MNAMAIYRYRVYRPNSDEPLVVSINALNDSLIMQMFPEVKAVVDSMENGSTTTALRDGQRSERGARIETASRMAKQMNAGRQKSLNR